RDQRLLPSMMIATCSGGDTWLTGSSWASDLHDLGFFASRHLVDQADVAIGELLQLLTTSASLVGRDLFLPLEGLDPIHLLTPDVAHRHMGAFRVSLDQPGVFPAPLLVQRRNRHPDQLTVVAGIQPQFGFLDRLLHRIDDGPVPGLDDDHACLRDRDGGQLIQRRWVAEVLDRNLVHERRTGAPGADGQDLFGQGVQALLHLGLGVLEVGLDHDGGPTYVPICLPATTPSRLPAWERSKTMIGILFSRQSVTAVWSMTRRSLLIRSR